MKTFTEQLEDLKSEAQKKLIPHFENGELCFSERTITTESGGWRQGEYIDLGDLYKLSAEFVCDLADEFI